jgi:beta-lactam-binding protein with PASTA domain
VARNDPEEMLAQPVSASQTVGSAAAEAALPDDDVMPDLRGRSAREALRTLTKLGMTASMTGDGVVLEQAPAAGSPLAGTDAVTLTLGRRPPSATGGQPH